MANKIIIIVCIFMTTHHGSNSCIIDSNLITANRREQKANNHASPRMINISRLGGIINPPPFDLFLLLPPLAFGSREDEAFTD